MINPSLDSGMAAASIDSAGFFRDSKPKNRDGLTAKLPKFGMGSRQIRDPLPPKRALYIDSHRKENIEGGSEVGFAARRPMRNRA